MQTIIAELETVIDDLTSLMDRLNRLRCEEAEAPAETQPTLMSIFKRWVVQEWIEAAKELAPGLNPDECAGPDSFRQAIRSKYVNGVRDAFAPPKAWGLMDTWEDRDWWADKSSRMVLLLAVLRHALVLVRNSEFRGDLRKSHAEIFQTCLVRVGEAGQYYELIHDDLWKKMDDFFSTEFIDSFFDASDLQNVPSLRDAQKNGARECDICYDGSKAVARQRCCKAAFCGECMERWRSECEESAARAKRHGKPVPSPEVPCPMCRAPCALPHDFPPYPSRV
jgi:hypothetical protein